MCIRDSDSTTNTALSVLQGGGTGKVDLALAGGAGSYSSSAATNDGVLRAMTGKLHLQSGSGAAAITINTNNVGMGTTTPKNKLDVRGKLSLGDATPDSAFNGALQITRPTSGSQYINLVRSGKQAWSLGYAPNTNTFGIGGGMGTDSSFNPSFRMEPNGKTLINTTDSSQGDLSVGGSKGIVSVGSRNGSPGYARIVYENGGRIVFEGYNTNLNNGEWRGFSMDGNNDIDWRSDRRLKKDIVDAEPMLDRLMQLPFRRYRWKDTTDVNPIKEFGVIAQEVEPLFPDLIGAGEDGIMTVGYTSFATIACKAIQELKIEKDDEIDDLRADLSLKDAEIADLTARLLALEKLVSGNR